MSEMFGSNYETANWSVQERSLYAELERKNRLFFEALSNAGLKFSINQDEILFEVDGENVEKVNAIMKEHLREVPIVSLIKNILI